jgi:argininosuccinate synthase
MEDKVILAYSGGLDTSVAIKWIKENYKMEVIAVLIDCGQPDDLYEAHRRAKTNGAFDARIIDAKS